MKIQLTKKDFKIEWYSGQGAGGQHRNKHQNCCRVTHKESGIVTRGTEARSRIENVATAFDRMAKELSAWYSERHKGPTFEISNEVIRVYHAERNEVIDKASGMRRSFKEVVTNGNIGEVLEARRKEIGNDE